MRISSTAFTLELWVRLYVLGVILCRDGRLIGHKFECRIEPGWLRTIKPTEKVSIGWGGGFGGARSCGRPPSLPLLYLGLKREHEAPLE